MTLAIRIARIDERRRHTMINEDINSQNFEKPPASLKLRFQTLEDISTMDEITEDQTYNAVNFKEKPLAKGEYDNCSFINCDFSNCDLSGSKFSECEFNGCNLSLVKLNKTALRNILFKNCKMLGLNFEHCNDFGLEFNFDNCTLNHSTFYKIKIKNTNFVNTNLQETDFTECDLTGAVFDNCDLASAVFSFTILEKADLRSAHNYAIDPDTNRIKRAKFSLSGLPGLLQKYNIEIDLTI